MHWSALYRISIPVNIFFVGQSSSGQNSYIVRIINPKWKSDVVTQTWHNVHDRFTSPKVLRQKMMATSTEQNLRMTIFSIGYYEKPGNSKCWIANENDLEAMYRSYNLEDAISLWCDGRTEVDHAKKSSTTSSDDSNDGLNTKRARKDKELETIYENLCEKHSEQYSDPQLRLWARMYVNGIHKDLDITPNVPAITGQIVKRKERSQPLTDALVEAATAITKLLVKSPPDRPSPRTSDGISPGSKANLSG